MSDGLVVNRTTPSSGFVALIVQPMSSSTRTRSGSTSAGVPSTIASSFWGRLLAADANGGDPGPGGDHQARDRDGDVAIQKGDARKA